MRTTLPEPPSRRDADGRPELAGDLERREFLKGLALLAGGALSASCARAVLERPAADPLRGSRAVLSSSQRELVAVASELVIPATDTPGAREAGVPGFIETMLADWFEPAEREAFLAGLERLDRLAQERAGVGFARAGEPVQVAVLSALEAEASAAAPGPADASLLRGLAPAPAPPRAFFTALKELVVVGYYTSEPGATRELRYEPVPGTYQGCLPFSTLGRASSSDVPG